MVQRLAIIASEREATLTLYCYLAIIGNLDEQILDGLVVLEKLVIFEDIDCASRVHDPSYTRDGLVLNGECDFRGCDNVAFVLAVRSKIGASSITMLTDGVLFIGFGPRRLNESAVPVLLEAHVGIMRRPVLFPKEESVFADGATALWALGFLVRFRIAS